MCWCSEIVQEGDPAENSFAMGQSDQIAPGAGFIVQI